MWHGFKTFKCYSWIKLTKLGSHISSHYVRLWLYISLMSTWGAGIGLSCRTDASLNYELPQQYLKVLKQLMLRSSMCKRTQVHKKQKCFCRWSPKLVLLVLSAGRILMLKTFFTLCWKDVSLSRLRNSNSRGCLVLAVLSTLILPSFLIKEINYLTILTMAQAAPEVF